MLGAATAFAEGPRLQALIWTDPGHARAVLLEQPAACLDPAAPKAELATGRALFNAPGLLGGQAARAGLSCAGCHSNGRRNQWFRLDGISDQPGSADVSSSFFSLGRADGKFDPKPIPDLALPGKISRDPANGALERFLRGLIVEEFAGPEPTPAAIRALATYVRAVRVCGTAASQPRRMADDLALVRDSVAGARALAAQGDAAGAVVLLRAVRVRLGLIDERLVYPGQARLHRSLLDASRRIGLIEQQAAPDWQQLAAWQRRFDAELAPRLLAAEPLSLYSPTWVDKWLET